MTFKHKNFVCAPLHPTHVDVSVVIRVTNQHTHTCLYTTPFLQVLQ